MSVIKMIVKKLYLLQLKSFTDALLDKTYEAEKDIEEKLRNFI